MDDPLFPAYLFECTLDSPQLLESMVSRQSRRSIEESVGGNHLLSWFGRSELLLVATKFCR